MLRPLKSRQERLNAVLTDVALALSIVFLFAVLAFILGDYHGNF